MDRGVSTEFLYKLGLEYRYLYRYLAGVMSLDEALEELARKIKAFAKRQMIWFRKDKSIICSTWPPTPWHRQARK